MTDHEVYELIDVALQSGVTLPRVELAFRTYGELNAAGTTSWSCRRSTAPSTPTPRR